MVFDPETEAVLKQRAKVEIRKRMRALRNSIPEKAREARSQKIVEHLAGSVPFARAASVALFAPLLERNEVDVRPLDAIARRLGKQVAYPFLEDTPGEMSFRLAEETSLEERGNGFREPPLSAPELPLGDELLVVVPALAVALSGHRIGYGKGYYDRLLARAPVRSVAVAFDFQVLAEIPVMQFDRAVQWIITDRHVWETAKDGIENS